MSLTLSVIQSMRLVGDAALAVRGIRPFDEDDEDQGEDVDGAVEQ